MNVRHIIALPVLAVIVVGSSCGQVTTIPAGDSMKRQIEQLVNRINEKPDVLHSDYTPAVHQLIKIGLPALKNGVLELLLSNDDRTRMRAQRVLEEIALAKLEEREQRKLWEANGSYDVSNKHVWVGPVLGFQLCRLTPLMYGMKIRAWQGN